MSAILETNVQNPLPWDKIWNDKLEEYLQAVPRTGIFIQQMLPLQAADRILEIACGSSRDSIYLAKKGYRLTATDADEKTISYLQQRFSSSGLDYSAEDALQLNFSDNSFDLAFHNGLFVYYHDDSLIKKMLLEQARVAKRYLLIIVHNQLNKKLVLRFQKLAATQPLYDLRFFKPQDMEAMVRQAGISYKSLKILKFGGIADGLYKKKLKKTIPNVFFPWREHLVPNLYQWQRWKATERIACLIELMK